MSADLTTKVGIASISPGGQHLIYSIRDGGEDELTFKVRNLVTGEDREDVLPRALYSNVHFAHNGLGFYYVYRSRVNGPRLKFHLLGDDMTNDPELFGEGIGPESFINVRHLEQDHFRILKGSGDVPALPFWGPAALILAIGGVAFAALSISRRNSTPPAFSGSASRPT